jgi:hypothetical protein
MNSRRLIASPATLGKQHHTSSKKDAGRGMRSIQAPVIERPANVRDGSFSTDSAGFACHLMSALAQKRPSRWVGD